MIIRPYRSEKFDKPGFETFYEAVNFDGFVKRPISALREISEDIHVHLIGRKIFRPYI